jgi:hypothetical protein
LPIAVDDDQRSCSRTNAEEDESVFGFRMFRIMEEASVRVVEDRPGFLEPNSVLAAVAPVFPFVPIEPEHV